jgi:CheY-like chemotaxis protein
LTTREGEPGTTHPHCCVLVDANLPEAILLPFLQRLDQRTTPIAVPGLAYSTRKLNSAKQRLLDAHTHQVVLLSSLDSLRERFSLLLTDPPQPHLAEPDSADDTEADAVSPSLRGRNVLAITEMLRRHGMSVRHAANGRRGIETLQQSPDVDIILMDAMMPEMDGHATTAAIRGMPATTSFRSSGHCQGHGR